MDKNTSFAFTKSPTRSGSWTLEEVVFVEALVQEFEAGSLDLEDGVSLRAFLAEKCRCNVKRISKKMEGTEYNGRQKFQKMPFAKEEADARKARIQKLEENFHESVKRLSMLGQTSQVIKTKTPKIIRPSRAFAKDNQAASSFQREESISHGTSAALARDFALASCTPTSASLYGLYMEQSLQNAVALSTIAGAAAGLSPRTSSAPYAIGGGGASSAFTNMSALAAAASIRPVITTTAATATLQRPPPLRDPLLRSALDFSNQQILQFLTAAGGTSPIIFPSSGNGASRMMVPPRYPSYASSRGVAVTTSSNMGPVLKRTFANLLGATVTPTTPPSAEAEQLNGKRFKMG